MGANIINYIKRKKVAIISAVSVLGVIAAGATVLTLTQPQSAAAATNCQTQDQYPDTNILYCGLSGGNDAAQVISSFQSQYKANSDNNGHTDIQAAYNATGANSAMVNGMNTTNTKLGTAYSDGTIKVDGQVVATNINIGGRWVINGNNTFKHIEGDVYTRPYTTYFFDGKSQVQILVHFNSTGTADFAAMEPCGNMVTFTAVPPKQSLSCVSLTADAGTVGDTSVNYTFAAKATAQNVAITSYTFDFGDGAKQTVATNATTATSNSHAYTLTSASKTITITVTVNAGSLSKSCTAQIKLPPTTSKPQELACVSLTANPQDAGKMTYTFTAVAQPKSTTITSYTFTFGDGQTQTITTGASTTISSSHTYTLPAGASTAAYTANVTVTGPLGTFPNNPNDKTCSAPITLSSTPTPPVTPPTQLVNTGAGNVVGIFAATSIIGALFYHFVVRRKLTA